MLKLVLTPKLPLVLTLVLMPALLVLVLRIIANTEHSYRTRADTEPLIVIAQGRRAEHINPRVKARFASSCNT